ncbi:ribonuclease domain-containing protein [Rhodanobacter sp. L36]|uniref:ribonuclease domain-containing protein n=1 Tax=Rhodanobacter sp. L36 TaxID=1747221 RepID=UPI00131B9671|nr:ribonuclease domain-containing protein [Rhodanobacter sp. L36]
MRRPHSLLLLIVVAVVVFFWQRHAPGIVASPASSAPGSATARGDDSVTLPSFLPPEARTTLDAIARGGPFEHRQDGVVFGNYEHLLPEQPRGYYHEYTVETPGADTRGTRRIITGGTPPTVWYYTDDHYRSFRRVERPR